MTSGIKYHKVSHFLESSSAQHKLPHVNGPEVQRLLDAIKFEIPYKPSFKLNQEYDIPYLMGYDSQNDIVYGDLDFDISSFSGGDSKTTLMTHEEVEKKLESVSDLDYQQRHHIATHCENLMASFLKIDWAAYTRWTTLSWHESYAKWKGKLGGLRVPATLDMSPYVDEDDALVKAMRKAGAKDEPR